jgi:hypothetical protein
VPGYVRTQLAHVCVMSVSVSVSCVGSRRWRPLTVPGIGARRTLAVESSALTRACCDESGVGSRRTRLTSEWTCSDEKGEFRRQRSRRGGGKHAPPGISCVAWKAWMLTLARARGRQERGGGTRGERAAAAHLVYRPPVPVHAHGRWRTGPGYS